jgi:hypothetical protein
VPRACFSTLDTTTCTCLDPALPNLRLDNAIHECNINGSWPCHETTILAGCHQSRQSWHSLERRYDIHFMVAVLYVQDELTWNLEAIVGGTEIEYRLPVSAVPDFVRHKYGSNADRFHFLSPSFKRKESNLFRIPTGEKVTVGCSSLVCETA